MQITRILHASVNSADRVEATHDFYASVLGLAPAPRPDIGIPGSWLDVDAAQVHLVGFPTVGVAIDPSDHHICFGVTDLGAATAELDAAGVAWVAADQTQLDGRVVRQVFLADPAGNTIELQEDAR